MLIRYLHRPITWSALAVVVVPGILLLGTARQAHAGSEPPGLLPNLVADPPDNVSFETSHNEGGLSNTEGEAELLLRFNGYVHNDGRGALDVRGSRAAPTMGSGAAMEVARRAGELKTAKEAEEKGQEAEEPQPFAESTERELASPRMAVFQRLFKTNKGTPESNPEESPEAFEEFSKENEEYLTRSHTDVSSDAEMFYVNADGHHHWHLQHVAKYSLWNATKTAEVAPADKVGFCLEDSEHVEPYVEHAGKQEATPEAPVYSDDIAPYRDFCQRYLPNATSVYEGISPGWRDKYGSELGFQWVDASDVLPGEYWLREEVNPDKVIQEEGIGNKVAYAQEPTIVPGFDALPEAVSTGEGESVTITATSTRWEHKGEPIGEPSYTIVSPPQHGALEPVSGTDQAVYTPEAGYTGPDSYTFSASAPNSEFPLHPAVATVTIDVGAPPAPGVAISGAPAAMIAGTSVQLSASVTNDSPGVAWGDSAGSITSGGLYTAPSQPPAGGDVVITARSARGAQGQVTIAIRPVSAPQAAPTAVPCKSLSRPPTVCRPEAILIGRKLIMTTRVGKAGRIRLDAYIGHRLLGGCTAKTLSHRSFTCRLTLGKRISLRARIRIVASLRIGGKVFQAVRPAAPVPEMKMAGPGKRAQRVIARKASLWQLWCSPSMAM
jgi:hypothetical protein